MTVTKNADGVEVIEFHDTEPRPEPTTAAGWEALINELRADQQTARNAASIVSSEKSDRVLPAALGDTEAARAIEIINGEAAAFRAEATRIEQGIKVAEVKLAEARQAEEAARERERVAALRAAIDRRQEAAKAVDAAMAALAKAFADCYAAGREVTRLAGSIPNTKALFSKRRAAGAMRYHGIAKFADVAHVQGGACSPFAKEIAVAFGAYDRVAATSEDHEKET